MSLSTVALLASAAILIVALIDWRRGRTGFGSFRLNKEKSSSRYWAVIVLYINVAFFMFWLSGKALSEERERAAAASDVVIYIEESNQ